ncbi:MAG: NMD3-related protein [Candidatus Nanohaloarchaea archaeon]
METFCPKCGGETDGVGPRGLCADCYLEEHDLLDVPERIDVERCEHCGAVKVGMDRVEVENDREFIYQVLDHEIDGEDVVAVRFEEPSDVVERDDDRGDWDYHVGIIVETEVDGEPLQQEIETWMYVEQDQCDVCSKFHGGYYEYKIQLRGDHLDDALDMVMGRAAEVTAEDREEFVSNVAEQDDGYDVYVSSRDMAEELLKVLREQYDLTEKRSRELIGQEEGQKVYRSVVSARIS